MVKNKVLTPVLAGVLGLSIVGSGLGYYFVNKDSNDGKTEGGKAKLTQVADNINNTLGTAEKAIKGELDFAYNATATVSFGEGFTEKAGVSLQPISVTTVTKHVKKKRVKQQWCSVRFVIHYKLHLLQFFFKLIYLCFLSVPFWLRSLSGSSFKLKSQLGGIGNKFFQKQKRNLKYNGFVWTCT